MKQLYIFIIFCLFAHQNLFAQNAKDSIQVIIDTTKAKARFYPIIDSAALAKKKFTRDSIINYFLNPDPKRENPFFDKLIEDNLVSDQYLLSLPKNVKIIKSNYGLGKFLIKDPLWFLICILSILLLFGILKIIFSKEISLLLRAFFDTRTLIQINKEDNALVSWHFFFLYVLFSLTLGLFISIVLLKLKGFAAAKNIDNYLIISGLVFLFFGLKIFLLRFIGFLFQIQKLIRDYLNLIYLTYFNTLFLLLPTTLYLILSKITYGNLFSNIFLVAFLGIIGVQFIRITFNILLNYRLSKFYLILYLCTLEICPIILFAKTISNSL
ncbi:hypothetical protein A5893_06095 [Pedobacter psychrophilus]|uniref:DUF4271 domain-containing protein n=1 Tax=Pedobacter psychrophilus TaxID=1826909 RepID=A0A179DHG5_9SPHI|nr:DUF4271 domain-containing protein [Pedobacter psychrophilus]OAQ40516.1 hypothetical protein A5893_06095 [Pedobacter psychrophilus]